MKGNQMPVEYQPDLSKIDQLKYDLHQAKLVINGLYKELTKEQERAESLSSAIQMLNEMTVERNKMVRRNQYGLDAI